MAAMLCNSPAFSAATGNTSRVLNLDVQHTATLWHVLANQQMSQDEMLNLNGVYRLESLDEFARRDAVIAAKKSYANWVRDVKSAAAFSLEERTGGLGEYDFSSHAFPVTMNSSMNGTKLLVETVPGLNPRMYYQLSYNIPEELRSVEISEDSARSIMPSVNAAGRTVLMHLRLTATSAGTDSDGKRSIQFRTQSAVLFIPGLKLSQHDKLFDAAVAANFKNTKVRNDRDPLVLKRWESSKRDAVWPGPNIAGKWSGRYRTGKYSGKISMDLTQSRKSLSGNCAVTYETGGSFSQTTEPCKGGEISEGGDFLIGVASWRLIGRTSSDAQAIEGAIDNFYFDKGSFNLTRGSKSASDSGDESDSRPTNAQERPSRSPSGEEDSGVRTRGQAASKFGQPERLKSQNLDISPLDDVAVDFQLNARSRVDVRVTIQGVGDGGESGKRDNQVRAVLLDESGYASWARLKYKFSLLGRSQKKDAASVAGSCPALSHRDMSGGTTNASCMLEPGKYHVVFYDGYPGFIDQKGFSSFSANLDLTSTLVE